MSREANAFFKRLGEKFLDADRKSKVRCRFCDRKYADNLTKFKQHLCNTGSHSCPKIVRQLKLRAIKIYQLEIAVRKGEATVASLSEAVDKANKVFAITLKNDNNPIGIPFGGLNDADPHTDEDTGGKMHVYVGNRNPTCPVPMAEGTRGEQIATTDGPIVGAEIGESSKGRANTLPRVDVSSPLNPSQENAEKDPIILDPVEIEAKFAALERENAHLKAKFAALEQENADLRARVAALERQIAKINKLDSENADSIVPNLETGAKVAAQEQEIADGRAKIAALEQENVDFKAKFAVLEWQNPNINMLDLENADFNVPNLEIPHVNIHDWENEEIAQS